MEWIGIYFVQEGLRGLLTVEKGAAGEGFGVERALTGLAPKSSEG